MRSAVEWVGHLRSGGTTPWAEFPAAAGGRGDRFVPGAQQLELLRRVNLRGRASPDLVERILAASAPGRGRPDLGLAGAGEHRRFGPPPVDPADLPDRELLRVATGLLAEDLAALSTTAARPASPPRRPRRLRTRYELVGDPWLATGYTDQLLADGRPPGGAGRVVPVLGADLATMLGHTWAARALGRGGPAWTDFLIRVRARRRLPARADLVAVAERFGARPHTGAVRVVLDLAALPTLVGVRRLAAVPDLPADGLELARQVGLALSLVVLPEEQATLLATGLGPRLAPAPGGPPQVPTEHRDWVEDAAHRLAGRLARADYPVVGDPERVVPQWSVVAPPEPGAVLDLAVGLLLRKVHG